MQNRITMTMLAVAAAIGLSGCQRNEAPPATSGAASSPQSAPNAAVVPASPDAPDPSMTGNQPQKAVSPMGGNGTGNVTDPQPASANGSGNAGGAPAAPTGGDGAPGGTPKSP